MVEAQKDERKENRGYRSSIQRDVYMRNIANIIPNRSYLRSNADIPKLSEINFICKYFKI